MAYLDHAATTPMLDEALEAYVATARDRRQRLVAARGRSSCPPLVEESRERVAAALGARPSEVVFTGGGTESDNLAVKGIFWARRAADPRRHRVVCSAVEHHAVLDSVTGWPGTKGARRLAAVDALGRVDLDGARRRARRARRRGGPAHRDVGQQRGRHACSRSPSWPRPPPRYGVPFHTDAVQAVGQVPVDFAASGVAALTVTGHKLGGPAGVGALLLGRDVACTPLLHGGGQERDVRSGTLDTAGIVAFAVAVETRRQGPAGVRRPASARSATTCSAAGPQAAVPDVIYNGDPEHRLPGNAHFSFPGCEGDALLLLLDAQGIACSTGSACSAGVAQPSHVLLAMGADDDRARSSLRFSPRPHLDAGGRRRADRRPARPSSSGPAGPGAPSPEPDRQPPRGVGARQRAALGEPERGAW